MATSTFNINPGTQGGSGAFGAVPGALSAPPSIYDQLNQNVPNYGAMTTSATGAIGSQLNGQLSPETMNLIQNKGAAAGVAGGVPGSQFATNNALANLGLTSEQLQQQGLTNYNQFSNTTGSQQQDPNLLASIAQQNAVNAAAPNPAAAASYAEGLFNKYLGGSGQGQPAIVGTNKVPVYNGSGTITPDGFYHPGM